MPTKTNISWSDYSSNPLRYRDEHGNDVWACVKVSAGCQQCYAAALAKRYGRGSDFNAGEMAKLTPYMDSAELFRLNNSKAISGKRVFLCDMTDLFGTWMPMPAVAELFNVIYRRSDVTWQILTKRPERMRQFVSWWFRQVPDEAEVPPWIWCGTSVENQAAANERIPHLLATPAAVRFLSAEPLLGPISLRDAVPCGYYCDESVGHVDHSLSGISWLIAGGESGPGYRPMEDWWLGDLVGEARRTSLPVFVKQDSGPRSGQQGRIPDDLWSLKQFPQAVPA